MPDAVLPPTRVFADEDRPYFLWWTDTTAADLRRHLADPDQATRAYWMGALLREANTRDVWQFVSADNIRGLWPALIPFLGRSRKMWAFLLQLPEPVWPPPEAFRAA